MERCEVSDEMMEWNGMESLVCLFFFCLFVCCIGEVMEHHLWILFSDIF